MTGAELKLYFPELQDSRLFLGSGFFVESSWREVKIKVRRRILPPDNSLKTAQQILSGNHPLSIAIPWVFALDFHTEGLPCSWVYTLRHQHFRAP